MPNFKGTCIKEDVDDINNNTIYTGSLLQR